MHSALALTPVLVFIPLLAFIWPVLFRLIKPCQPSELTSEWLESFQLSSYYPMRGLLASDDFQFISNQPGFDSSLFKKLREERLRIFRCYLNRLIIDFNRLYSLTQLGIAQSSDDQSALFSQLLKLRLRFSLSILQVEFSYLMCRLGISNISIGNSIQRLEEMRQHLTALPESRSLLAH